LQSGPVPPFNILKLGPKNAKLVRPLVNAYVAERADLVKYAGELFDMISSGKVKIKVHEVYPLSEVARAHTDLESRKTTGKLLLRCE
jgi:NADPH2:quinone reductase